MKKLFTLAMAFVALALIVSCGKDDPNPSAIEIDGDAVAGILNAYVIDAGTTCSQCKTDGLGDLRETLFLLTDGEFTFNTEGYIIDFVEGDLDMWIELETYSLNESFEPGNFEIWDWWCETNYMYNGAWLYSYWNDGSDIYYYGYDGSINIAKNGNKYTLKFNGEVYDYQDQIVTRTEGCSWNYNQVDITGSFTATFTPISEEVWSDWD